MKYFFLGLGIGRVRFWMVLDIIRGRGPATRKQRRILKDYGLTAPWYASFESAAREVGRCRTLQREWDRQEHNAKLVKAGKLKLVGFCEKCGGLYGGHNPWCITRQPKDEAPF